jgi:phosphate-selective porin OprO/OprP
MRPPLLPLLAAAALTPVFAQTAAPAAPSIYEKIWSSAVLYKGDAAAAINEVRIVGRQHIDWYQFRNGSTQDSDFVSRRTRLGTKIQFLNDFTLHIETDLSLEVPHPLFNKYTDAYVKWAPSKAFALTVGKQSVRYTLDGGTSSNSLLTIDRSPLAYNLGFSEEYLPGVQVEGESGPWGWKLGVFSAGTADRDFGAFNAGTIGFASVSRDVSAFTGLQKSSLRLDAMTQSNDAQNATGMPKAFSRNHAAGISLISQNTQGAWGFDAELGLTEGQGSQSDLKGVQLMPSYSFDKDWQAVLRYTRVTSAENNGVSFLRYESMLTSGKGDRLEEIYLGLNRYFYGHKLKFQLGVQHTKMIDSANDGGAYAGWGVTTGLRVSW